jgi:hypothetical protein
MMTMTKNPILDELYAIREQLLDSAGGTLDALVDRLQAEERDSDRPRYQARRTRQCTETTKSDENVTDN